MHGEASQWRDARGQSATGAQGQGVRLGVAAPVVPRGAQGEAPHAGEPDVAAARSASARRKERDHVTADGLPVHSFKTLLAELATLTRNRVVPAGADEGAAFEILAEPTPLQARAFELLGVSPTTT